MMMPEVFLDTAYAIALANPKDAMHQRAISLAEELEMAPTRLITTTAVALEIGNGLSKQRYRIAAIRLLSALETDQLVEMVEVDFALYNRARQLYQSRLDKEWGLTDCVSFIVMQDRGLREALTTDHHFEQAGFQVLLR